MCLKVIAFAKLEVKVCSVFTKYKKTYYYIDPTYAIILNTLTWHLKHLRLY